MTMRGATRREVVRLGLVGGGAAIAAGSVPPLLVVRNAFAQATGDAALLERAIELEQALMVAYDTAVGRGLLSKPLERSAIRLRDQERQHADALAKMLEERGGTVPEPPRAGQVRGLTGVKSESEMLRFAVELENMVVIAYIDAQRKLKDEKLLTLAAQIMANEGQHLVVLRQALDKDPLPSAFEAGTTTV
jgi:rubrerythrin